MKKFVSIVLTLVLVLGIAIPASASQITIGTIETEEQKLARVQAEVLSGNITNEQDVIEVALAQYAEKVAYCRENGIELDPNEPLTITQVIESNEDINGYAVERIAITGFMVEDSNGNVDQLTPYAFTRLYGDNTIGISSGSIIATTTMCVYENEEFYHRVHSISTTLTIRSGYSATSLYHVYECNVPGEDDYETSSVTSNPSGNFPHTFYPGSEYIYKNTIGPPQSFVGRAYITYGGSVYTCAVGYSLDSRSFISVS